MMEIICRLRWPVITYGVPINPFGACCGQLWVRHMICGQTCDELYHFTFYLIILEFRGVPSLRLYSEIDQIHLSSEAQCVSHHLPQVDCHSAARVGASSPRMIFWIMLHAIKMKIMFNPLDATLDSYQSLLLLVQVTVLPRYCISCPSFPLDIPWMSFRLLVCVIP